MLANRSRNRPLSLLASVSGELVVVTLLVIIPLAYNEHLPDFRWKEVAVGPPLKSIEQKPIPVRSWNGVSHAASPHRLFVVYPAPATPSVHIGAPIVAYVSEVPPTIDGIAIANNSAHGLINLADPMAIARPPVDPPAKPPVAPGPIRVSQGVQMAKLIRKVLPVYPPLAKSARVSGVVHLTGIIGKDGTIRNLQLVSGHPLLTRAAIDAVQQWVYQPTLLSGEPVEVICPIDVNFTLNP